MTSMFQRGADHERARTLLATRMDEPILPMDAEWLDGHLAACDACTAVAAEYEADRSALRSLLGATPEPPRDLWARTAAAIEAEAGRGRGATGAARPARRVLGIPAAILAPVSGLAVVAIVVGAALFNGSPVTPVSGATPIPLPAADVAVVSRGPDGSIQISTGQLHEACPITADGCSAEPSFDTLHIALGAGDVQAVISPKGDHLVVIKRDASGNAGVYVVPVHSQSTASPTPTAAATATQAPTPAPTPTATATATPTEGPSGTPSEAPASPASSPEASPVASATPEPSSTDTSASEPPTSPSASPTDASPEPSVSPEASEPPTATPTIAVTPRPDGALEIASNVVVVAGPATYSADGSHFAFTARPADGSGGPDVYVWDTKDAVARAITDDDRSVFADWAGDDLLVSRVDEGVPTTTRVDVNGKAVGDESRHAWLPTLSPDGSRAAWWDGSVTLAGDGVTWVPDAGHLVAGSWSDASADVQTLSDGKIGDWQVRWDPDGGAVATWLTPKGSHDAGRLSLYRLDPSTGRLDLAKPMLADEPALGAFTLDPGLLAWSAPGKSAGRTLQVLAWKGDHVDRGEVPADGDATLVQ